jgi:predicted dehydrogenase
MTVRVGVIGCGSMGRNHARVYSRTPGCDLTAVCDLDAERAEAVAAPYGAQAFDDPEAVLSHVDAVTVAVPTEAHLEVAEMLLHSGVDVLVEKPLAADLEQADTLIEAAGAHRVLAVGHTERFNPAVAALLSVAGEPRFLEVHRLGVFPDRSTDVDVVRDLMVHDLDIVLHLVDRPLEALEAVGIPVLTDQVDIANVRLSFEGGCVANLTSSRVSREKIRKLRIFQSDAYISVDYAERSGTLTRLDRSAPGRPEILTHPLEVEDKEPLALELEDFLRAVRTREDPTVPGWQGRRALEAALSVGSAIEDGLRAHPPSPESDPA